MRVKEKIKKSGYFWLPSVPEKKIAGTLNISDGGKIELEVAGLFDENIERGKFERIVGQIEKYGFSLHLMIVFGRIKPFHLVAFPSH